MENKAKDEILKTFTKELINNIVLYNGNYEYNRGIKELIEGIYSNDVFSHLDQRVAERTEELREMYDVRPLPVDVFSYPDYKAEEKIYNDIVDRTNSDLLKVHVVNYFVETNRALFQIRHLILWNIGSIVKEFNIKLEDERKTLLMATDSIIHALTNIEIDTNRKDRLLTYSKDSMNIPEVTKLLTELKIIDLIKE